MKVIHKFDLDTEGLIHNVPCGAEFLTIQVQHGQPRAWFVVDPAEEGKEDKTFYIFGTGHTLPEGVDLTYIETIQISGGKLVFHIFKRKK